MKPQITPCLWYDSNAEEAAQFYLNIFPNSKILKTTKYGEAESKESGQPKGSVMNHIVSLNRNEFMLLNGGPTFKFTAANSYIIFCENQEEVDKYYESLSSEGGEQQPCGWVKDKFGVSWQIVPSMLDELASDSEKFEKIMSALMKMKKIDIAELEKAAEE